jgi:hypothetical protein
MSRIVVLMIGALGIGLAGLGLVRRKAGVIEP